MKEFTLISYSPECNADLCFFDFAGKSKMICKVFLN